MILGVCNWLSHESKINVIIIRFTFILSLFFGNAPVFLIYFSIYLVMKYPILLERPIVSIERNKKIIQSIICRPTELIKSVFS